MKVTVTKIARALKNYNGWDNLNERDLLMIKDVINLVDIDLRKYKNISIRK